MAAQAKALAADTGADRCLVIVPRVTDRTAEFLRRQGIDYIDLRGNIRVSVPGRVLVMARTERGASSVDLPFPKDRIANPFAGKASRIVRVLLAEPPRWWGVTELADRVEVSAGTSVKTLRALETTSTWTAYGRRPWSTCRDREPIELEGALESFRSRSGRPSDGSEFT